MLSPATYAADPATPRVTTSALDVAGSAPSTRPIFILSPLPRSGTNFLWDLLRLHDGCAAGRSPIWEDYLVKNSRHLIEFVDAAHESWDAVWGPTGDTRSELLASLGAALVSFMTIDPQRRLVTKSPTLDNLEVFFDLFPDAHLLLLVRDGRDVVASGMTTFGWDLEDAARAWAHGVARALRFTERGDVPADQCSIVRYEDLHERPHATMKALLDDLALPTSGYRFDEVDAIPVRGSSTYRGDGSAAVHWNPVTPGPEFKPTRRWAAWDRAARHAFHSAAGAQLALLGYPT